MKYFKYETPILIDLGGIELGEMVCESGVTYGYSTCDLTGQNARITCGGGGTQGSSATTCMDGLSPSVCSAGTWGSPNFCSVGTGGTP